MRREGGKRMEKEFKGSRVQEIKPYNLLTFQSFNPSTF
jgi:hypothetical protein